MMRVYSLLFGLALLQFGCQSPNEECCDGPKEVILGEAFSIKEGETVDVQNSIIELTFTHLVNDSLCPIDATCVTEGYLTISIDINGTERTLSTGATNSPITVFKDYTIELQRLVYPTKVAEKASGNATYAVQMMITRS